MNFQKNHNDLIFVKADKGNIMVVANRNDYNQTLENNLFYLYYIIYTRMSKLI